METGIPVIKLDGMLLDIPLSGLTILFPVSEEGKGLCFLAYFPEKGIFDFKDHSSIAQVSTVSNRACSTYGISR